MRWGRQAGRVSLSDRKLRVSQPRLCSRSGEEVAVPVYEAMQRDELLRATERELDLIVAATRRGREPADGAPICALPRVVEHN